MDENADQLARRDLSRLCSDFRELASDYWGPDKGNGKRSVVIEHDKAIADLKTELRHYLDKGREETCFGCAALTEHELAYRHRLEGDEKEDTTMKIAEIQTSAQTRAAGIQAFAQIAVQGLILAGIAFLAIKGK